MLFGCCSGVIDQELHVYLREIWDKLPWFVSWNFKIKTFQKQTR